MLQEYDFSGGIRGREAARHGAGTVVVVLDPEVAKFFPGSKSVNGALRALMDIARRNKRKP